MTEVSAPHIDIPYDGDPLALVEPLERAYGSLLVYRLAPPSGRRMLFASLADVWRVHDDGIRRGGDVFAGDVADLLDRVRDDARAHPAGWAPDTAVALAYDLTWQLRAAHGVPNPPVPPRADLPHLGFAGPLRHTVVWHERDRMVRCAPADAEAVAGAIAAAGTGHVDRPPAASDLTDVLVPVDRDRYAKQVETIREHLRRGDIYQALIAVRTRVRPRTSIHRYFGDIAHRYRDADFCYWFSLDGVTVFGSCSLPHLALRGHRAWTRVFAGTQPAARTEAERSERRAVLRSDPKYFAEHVMLVDLERNDFGRFSRLGRVSVARYLEPVVIGPTTYLATEVLGEVAPGTGFGDTVLATFPRGVAIGAPKIRAQEIIAEVEVEPRGYYTGMIGVYDGAADRFTSTTIVTCAQADGDDLVLHCGGGLVAGSDTEQELREINLKLSYLR